MTIMVLEDTMERIKWLQNWVTADVEWAWDVADFFDRLRIREPENVRLILLDHDLGAYSAGDSGLKIEINDTFPKDMNGMCGMDAADQLPLRWKDVPIIVWSINTPRAQEMVHRLTERGFGAVHVPFNNAAFGPLRRAIRSVLDQHDARVSGHRKGEGE